MKGEDQTALMVLAVVWAYGRAVDVVDAGVRAIDRSVKAVERGGASVWEATHDSHGADLPGRVLSKRDLTALAKYVGFPDPRLAAAIALAESGGVPNALGDSGSSVGLWQVHLPAWPQYSRGDMANPLKNARAAYRISKGGRDFRPWSTYKTGKYRGYL